MNILRRKSFINLRPKKNEDTKKDTNRRKTFPFTGEGVFTCPDDGTPLDYAKIYPDSAASMEVESQLIHCPHHKPAASSLSSQHNHPSNNNSLSSTSSAGSSHSSVTSSSAAAGCRWIGSVNQLSGHLATCRYDSRPCSNECGARLSRICLSDHLAYTCPLRRVMCTSCNKEFSGEALESHQGNCPYEVTWCENKCGARLQLRYLNNHMKNECHKRTVPCPHCSKSFVFETLQNHYHQCPRYPVSCPNRCDPAKIAREDVEGHVHETCPSVAVPCSFQRFGCKHVCPRYNMEQHLAAATKQHLNLMCELSLTQERRIHDLTHQLHVLSLVTDGTFIWRIPNFAEQLAEAQAKPGIELLSDPFYTGRYGYKLGASVFLNGNGSGEDTHISLYIRVLPGDYDNLMEWPFRLPITFRIMDQCADPEKREHVVESFVPNPQWKHFQRPVKNVETMGFGYPKFISHEQIVNGTYIKDDTLFVKIEIDNSQFIAP